MLYEVITPAMIHLFFWCFTIISLVPFILIFMVSISSEDSILQKGFSLFPNEISFEAYKFLFNDFSEIARAYGVTIIATLIGTVVSLLITVITSYSIHYTKLYEMSTTEITPFYYENRPEWS